MRLAVQPVQHAWTITIGAFQMVRFLDLSEACSRVYRRRICNKNFIKQYFSSSKRLSVYYYMQYWNYIPDYAIFMMLRFFHRNFVKRGDILYKISSTFMSFINMVFF